MQKGHAIAVALLLGLACAVGLVAATRSAGLAGDAQARVSETSITARARKLDQVERSLQKAIRDRPPALPAVRSMSPGQRVPRVIYQRPAPLVVVSHRVGGEHEAEEREHDDRGDD